MKIKNNPPRPGLATHFKDRIVVRYDPKYGQVAQSWPRRNAGGKPRGDPAKVALWDAAIEWVKAPEPSEYAEALKETNGTAFYARDIMISAIYGNYISWPGWGWRVQLAQNIQTMLDSITDIPGSILVRREDGWHGLGPGTDAQVLTISGLGAFPNWADAPIAGVTELTGDVEAGPGSGSVSSILSNTGVVAGVYTLASIEVDTKGRLLNAASGSISPGINQLTGDVTAGPGSGSVSGTLASTGVVAGSYTAANLTVDAKGRVTTIANSGIVSGINQLTGDVTAGPGSGSVSGTLASTGVVAGSYTAANLTVDAKGRVTTIADSGIVSGINQLTGDVTAGPGSGSVPGTLASTGVTPGTYTNATVTVDAKGRATSASSGALVVPAAALHPGFITGRGYSQATTATFATVSASPNFLNAYPIVIPFPHTFTGMAIRPIATASGAQARLGVYSSTNGLPDALIIDAGVLAVASTGVKTITGLSIPLAAGVYWLAVVGSALQQYSGFSSAGTLGSWQMGNDLSLNNNQQSSGWQRPFTFVSGGLPANFAPTTDLYGASHIIWLIA